MCLALPMRLVERRELTGIAELDGVRREVALMLLPESVEVGDHVLVHAGYALARVARRRPRPPWRSCARSPTEASRAGSGRWSLERRAGPGEQPGLVANSWMSNPD